MCQLSSIQLQAKLMRDYYKNFSKYAKGRKPEQKIAWVTSFTPVEILEALGIAYYYPESYAAVIAASGQEQELLEESESGCLSTDCCNYSCCIEGSILLEKGPRGTIPVPDVLIATNNQCNTLPNWWNILSERYHVPLLIIDYPGETSDERTAIEYVTKQHRLLIDRLESLSGRKISMEALLQAVSTSKKSVEIWKRIAGYMSIRDISPTVLFDGISFLITSRCKPGTVQMYEIMEQELAGYPIPDESLLPLFWIGYPLWYHEDRYFSEFLDGCRISGANYITWWNLDYDGDDPLEQLFHAYNYTFLNLTQKTRTRRLMEQIRQSKAAGAISVRNKSCKCDFVSAKEISIPQAELEVDMINRNYVDVEKADMQIQLLKESLCTR